MAASRGAWALEPFSSTSAMWGLVWGSRGRGTAFRSSQQRRGRSPPVQWGTGLGPSASVQPPLAFDCLKRGGDGVLFRGRKGLVPYSPGDVPPGADGSRRAWFSPLPRRGWAGSGMLVEVCGSVGWPGASSMPKRWGALGRAVPSSSLPPHKGRRL